VDVEAPKARAQTGINADVLSHGITPADFDSIQRQCGAVRWAALPDNQPKVSRDYWRGLLGIVKFCAGAEGLAREVSKHHPKYDLDETANTLDGWEKGPTTCEYFAKFGPLNGGACPNCQHVESGTNGGAV
jgi:hypothetical protein